MVRAKFRCLEVTERYSHTDGDGLDIFTFRVKLAPVFGNRRGAPATCPENEQFYALTPAGEIELQLVRADTAATFKPGQAYFVDFSPTDG